MKLLSTILGEANRHRIPILCLICISFAIVVVLSVHVFSAEETELVGDNSLSVKELVQSVNKDVQNVEQLMDPTETMGRSLIEDKSEVVTVILEEVEPLTHSLDESDVTAMPTTAETIEELITSEYNGLDDKEQSSESFSCYGRSFGQYADMSKDCRFFHLCYPFFNSTSDELLYQRITFMCDGESVFDQKRFVCVDNSTIDHKCSDSEALYMTTNQEYLIRVFSQSVSPIDEVKGRSESDPKPSSSSSPGWFNWFYGN